MGLENGGFNSGVVLILGGLKAGFYCTTVKDGHSCAFQKGPSD